jgi:predicted CoA-substrate-specific enzyme activase
MKYYAGIDLGSTTCKCVIVDAYVNTIAETIVPTGKDVNHAFNLVFNECLNKKSLKNHEIADVTVTGYGRYVPKNGYTIIPEIQSIAIGVHADRSCIVEHGNKVIFDIGGQDCKVLLVDTDGQLVKFVTNDKCAAGTGKFLENIGKKYNCTFQEMSEMAFSATGNAELNSLCGIFIESEMFKLLSDGVKIEDVFAALFRNMYKRLMGIYLKLGHQSDSIHFTGGVSKSKYFVNLLNEKFTKVNVSGSSQFICALGAATHAQRQGK